MKTFIRKKMGHTTEPVRSPYTEHAASGLPNPTPLEWGGGMIYPGSRPAGVITRSPRMVAECSLTRSMFKMYYHFMECACICTILFTVSQFHADVYLVYLFSLSNCIHVFV